MENLLQIILSSILLSGAILVLTSKNPVHSVMFLILVFLCSAGILIYIGAEFIALIFIIVYVGAIAILFLFIVMMLNIKKKEINSIAKQYTIISFLISGISLLALYLYSNPELNIGIINSNTILNWQKLIDPLTNVEIIGQVFFEEFFFCFLLCGVLLLIAMIGAIVLTQNFSSARTNDLALKQLARSSNSYIGTFKQ